jgi:hypothetical protein
MSNPDNQKQDRFARVFYDVLLDPTINDSASLVYGMLISSCYGNTNTFISNVKLSEQSGKSLSSIKNALTLLKEQNYIVVTGSNRTRLIFPKHLTPDLTDIVQTPNTRIFNEREHKFMEACLAPWGERVKVGEFEKVAGALHKLSPRGMGQTKTVWRIHQYLQDANQGNLLFYDRYIDKLTTSWLEKTGITREKVLNSTKTLKDVLKTHLDLLRAGEKKEGFRLIPNSLEHFFIQTQKTPENKPIVSSWFLYWLCKDQIVAENIIKQKENVPVLQRKYPDKFTQYYKTVGEVFGVNINKLDKSPTLLNNQVLLLSEAIIDEIKEKNRYLAKKAKLNVSTLTEDIQEFLKSQDYISQFNPTQFMPSRKSWNNMVDHLAGKTDECYKKTFDVLYHDVISSDF